MKRLSVLAITTAIGIAGSTVFPVQAADAGSTYRQMDSNIYGVTVIQGTNMDELQEILSGPGSISNIYWQLCPPAATPPETDTPDIPDHNVPDTDIPDTDVPDTSIPDTDIPDTEVPDTDIPDHNIPDTDNPDSGKPGPDTDKPGEDAENPGDDVNQPDGDGSQPDNGGNSPGTDTEERTFAEQVVDLVNAERVKAGLTTIRLDQEIEKAALVRAKEIESSFSHTRPNGSSFSTALTEQGITFKGSGENIAWGQRSPQEVMQAWMNSNGHRANILNPKFTKMGVGYHQNAGGRNYWTQLFTY